MSSCVITTHQLSPYATVCRWGSSFSNKFFLEKRFVVKHIYNKHQQRLEEQRDVIRDELYWLAYEKANKAKHAAEREIIKQQEADRVAATTAAASAAGADAQMSDPAAVEWHVSTSLLVVGSMAEQHVLDIVPQ